MASVNGPVVSNGTPLAPLSPAHTPGTNLIRTVFLEPDNFEFEPDPREDFVAGLRGLAGTEMDDPGLEALVEELSMRSGRFQRLWARHDVRGRTIGRATILHPQAGTLTALAAGLPPLAHDVHCDAGCWPPLAVHRPDLPAYAARRHPAVPLASSTFTGSEQ
ncbi:hypothetical protein ABTX71_34025 [Streptomyces parvulus]|uniref:MmyB family transcriptional regulator n=1 Tax=Streptomyces parvulus TaxID=146923 RepID=UPI00332796C2